MALVAESQEELDEKEQLWQGALTDKSLRLNVKRTKFISCGKCTGPILDCQRKAIENVEEFRYLGGDLSEDGGVDQVTDKRSLA